MTQKDLLQILELACVIVVATAMFTYGFGKYIQFQGNYADQLISELEGRELMWAFYSYSRPFVLLIGIFEVAGGILLLIPRTRIIGSLFLTTILVNVILQDIFFDVNRGALWAAIIYQFLLLVILYLRRAPFLAGLQAMMALPARPSIGLERWWKWLLVLLFAAAIKLIEYWATH